MPRENTHSVLTISIIVAVVPHVRKTIPRTKQNRDIKALGKFPLEYQRPSLMSLNHMTAGRYNVNPETKSDEQTLRISVKIGMASEEMNESIVMTRSTATQVTHPMVVLMYRVMEFLNSR